ncbi:hypothetical protein SO802_022656 [Lithocarpus litseifolius]|uniref:Uncharacterized protein n=1 Tax=Lithocarpus litseifolius TaxID=425828 RepID=A0AAW2C5H3_9ROSI
MNYIGLSEASASTIRRAYAVHPITAVWLDWSLWSRDVEEEIIPTCSGNLSYGLCNTPSATLMDNPLLYDYNVEKRVNDFINNATFQANVTRTNHIMWTICRLIFSTNMLSRGSSKWTSLFTMLTRFNVHGLDGKRSTRSNQGGFRFRFLAHRHHH